MNAAFYRGAAAVVLVFDVGSRRSLASLPTWLSDVQRVVKDASLPVFIIGNKTDLPAVNRQITTAQVEQVAQRLNAKGWWLCSAREGDNVDEAFKKVAMEVDGLAADRLLSSKSAADMSIEPIALDRLEGQRNHGLKSGGGCCS